MSFVMRPNISAFLNISRRFLSVRLQGHFKTRAAQLTFVRDFRTFNSFLQQTTFNMQAHVSKEDHLMRTSKNTRDDGIHPVIVKVINELSPTIKEVVLVSEKLPPPFTFKAGQWVDVFIPNVKTVGGFSMCSSPEELINFGILKLAVKYSSHPPALWMHEKCQVGDTVSVRVGGDFYLACENDKTSKAILLIAGGVGINPMSSMVHYAMTDKTTFGSGSRMCLLYSAKTKDELIFKNAFDSNANMNPNFNVKYFATQRTQNVPPTSDEESIEDGRICLQDLQRAITWLTASINNVNVQAFICGPPSMITDVTDALRTLNITSIHFEKWW